MLPELQCQRIARSVRQDSRRDRTFDANNLYLLYGKFSKTTITPCMQVKIVTSHFRFRARVGH